MLTVIKMIKNKDVIKKNWKTLEKTLEIPSNVTIKYESPILTVKGEKGEISKKLRYPNVYININSNIVEIGTKYFSQREKKIISTYYAHLKNMISGVTEGFEYKLVIVYAKFPMTVSMTGQLLEVKNLLGEKVPRKLEIPSDVKVQINGKDIVVTGIDKEKTGQVAASIEQLTKITHLDRRVIQDGIYITKKPHRSYA